MQNLAQPEQTGIRSANFALPRATIEDIEYHKDRKLDKAQIMRFATCKYIDEGHHIILKGASGNGKTYIACALGNAACRKFKSVRYIRLPELLEELSLVRAAGEIRKTAGSASNLNYLEITITKTIYKGGAQESTEPITETSNIIEFVIPYDFTGKSTVKVYRYHNGTAKALTEASTGAESKSVAVTKNADGTYSYTQPSSNVTVSARFVREGACLQDNTCPISKYSDANAKAWYHDGVHWALENGVMNGYDSGKFGPSDDTSRAMIVTMLWRMEGGPVVNYAMSYSDVGDNWFAEAVRWASANGIVTGYDNGGFGPSDAVTREQLAAILYRYAQYKKLDVSGSADLSGYADASDLHGYAVDAVKWACSAGIVTGAQSGGKLALAPREASTRAVVATMLMRFREGAAK